MFSRVATTTLLYSLGFEDESSITQGYNFKHKDNSHLECKLCKSSIIIKDRNLSQYDMRQVKGLLRRGQDSLEVNSDIEELNNILTVLITI